MNQFEKLREKYPFLSHVKYAGNEFIGIVQNFDKHCLSIYDINKLNTLDERKLFLEMGDVWWNESAVFSSILATEQYFSKERF